MSDTQNIQIPRALFDKIIFLVDYLRINDFMFPQMLKFDDIHMGLRAKQHSINLRSQYSEIIYAKGDERKEAQKNYQILKRKK